MTSTVPSLGSVEWFVDLGVVVIATLAVALLARWLLRRASSRTKNVVASAAVLLLAACIVLADFPGVSPVQRFAETREVLAGVVTSVLLVGAGLLAVDARSERERSKQAAAMRRAACDDVVAAWTSMLSDHYGAMYADLDPGASVFVIRGKPSSPESRECREGLTTVVAVADSWVPALVRQDDDATRALLDSLFVLRSRIRDVLRMWDHDGRLRQDWVHPVDGTLDFDADKWDRLLMQAGAAMETLMYRAVDEDGSLRRLPATFVRYRTPVVKLPVPYLWSPNEALQGDGGSPFVRLSTDTDSALFAEFGLLCAGMALPAVVSSIGNVLMRHARSQARGDAATMFDWTPDGGSETLRKAVAVAEEFAHVTMSTERAAAAAKVPGGAGRTYDGAPWLAPTDWRHQNVDLADQEHWAADEYDEFEWAEPEPRHASDPCGPPDPSDFPGEQAAEAEQCDQVH